MIKIGNNARYFGIVLATILIQSCSTSAYVPPTDGPTSRVRFVATPTSAHSHPLHHASAEVRGYEGANCETSFPWTSLLDTSIANRPVQNIGMPLNTYERTAASEYKVSSSRPLRFTMRSSLTDKEIYRKVVNHCVVFVDVTLNENTDYEFAYAQETPSSCKVKMYEIRPSDDGYSKHLISTYPDELDTNIMCALNVEREER